MPESCLPYSFSGHVVKGFGRGGKQLGCPTANLDDSVIQSLPPSMPCGVFYGLARVDSGEIHDMVMSIGWNPHFHNEKKTVEVHLLHSFSHDFYSSQIDCVVLGFIREMTSFSSLQALQDAIQTDISTARLRLSTLSRLSLFSQHFLPLSNTTENVKKNDSHL